MSAAKSPTSTAGKAQETEAKGVLEYLDPGLIRWSRFYNRSPLSLQVSNPRFQSLVGKIEANQGNAQAVMVFRLEGDPDGYLYEIVYGHRRLEACKLLGLDLYAIVVNSITREEQAKQQLLENEDHDDVSVIERAKQISSHMKAKVWPTVETLANEVGYTRTYAQHLKTIGDVVPDSLLLSHPDTAAINFRQAQALVKIAKCDMGLLKTRLEVLRKQRGEISGCQATTYLLTGEMKIEEERKTKTSASIKRKRDGCSVSVTGLDREKIPELEEQLSEFFKKLGFQITGS